MPIRILSFQGALNEAGDKKHLLLGNGFSISWKPNVFKYESLFKKANFENLSSDVKKLFEYLGTTDFEIVMKSLLRTAAVLKVYSPSNRSLIDKIENDALNLKNILVNTIAENHPESPGDISEAEYDNCAQFLNNFEHIYTLNYDLLLYWTIMHFNKPNEVVYDDGFRTPDYGQAEYVTWDIEKTKRQNVFYLHGALHIFDEGVELQKYTWINTGVKLINQIREALNRNYFPLFVSEGSSKEKKERIVHSNYLSRGFRSLASIGNSLFIFGSSFADNDEHILNLMPKGKITKVFVSIYGNQNAPENLAIIKRAQSLGRKRTNPKYPLQIYFFKAEDARVWR